MLLHQDTVKGYLQVAKRAAFVSGEYLRKREKLDVVSCSGKDIRLVADLESEKRLVEIIGHETGMRILSEESGIIEGGNSGDGRTWIIDPLDGSYNYKNNIPACCVSIGLWDDDGPILGAVYDFVHEEMFSGISGGGAWLNDVKIEVGWSQSPSEAAVLTGFPIGADYEEGDLRDFLLDVYQYKKVRMIGSAALSLAYVAAGRADSYQERGIMFWDVAGGLAVVTGAGGKYVVQPYKDQRYCFSVKASNGRLDITHGESR